MVLEYIDQETEKLLISSFLAKWLEVDTFKIPPGKLKTGTQAGFAIGSPRTFPLAMISKI